MKKYILSLVMLLICCMTASAQQFKVMKGDTNVKTWTINQVDSIAIDEVEGIEVFKLMLKGNTVATYNRSQADRVEICKGVMVTAIDGVPAALDVWVGNITKLTATANKDASDQTLTWSSSDESVVMVSQEGHVAAINEGTTTITATANDGSGKEATCTVKVFLKPINLKVKVTSSDIATLKAIKVVYQAQGDASKEKVLTVPASQQIPAAEGTVYSIAIPSQTYAFYQIYLSEDGTTYKEAMATKSNVGAITEDQAFDYEKNAVQLWADGPFFAEFNVGSTITSYANVTSYDEDNVGGYYTWGGSTSNSTNDQYSGTDYDSNGNLKPENDTATKLWGSAWRMPTKAELEALTNTSNTDATWLDATEASKQYASGCTLKGRKYVGKNGYSSNSVFFPAPPLKTTGPAKSSRAPATTGLRLIATTTGRTSCSSVVAFRTCSTTYAALAILCVRFSDKHPFPLGIYA